jgi:hypothetical protein
MGNGCDSRRTTVEQVGCCLIYICSDGNITVYLDTDNERAEIMKRSQCLVADVTVGYCTMLGGEVRRSEEPTVVVASGTHFHA